MLDAASTNTGADSSANQTGANATQGGMTDAGNVVEAMKVRIGEREFVIPPEQIDAHKEREKFLISHYNKQYQSLSEKLKAAEAKEASYQKAIANLPKFNQQVQEPAAVDPEYARARAEVEKIIEDRTKPIQEKLEELAKIKQEMKDSADQQRALSVTNQMSTVLNQSGLDERQGKLFVTSFIGQYDVNNMPISDSVDEFGNPKLGVLSLFNKELREFSGYLKTQGLLKNKEYVDAKNKNKSLATDARGTSGLGGQPAKPKTPGQQEKDRYARMAHMFAEKFPNGL